MVQYTAIAKIAVCLMVFIVLSYTLRPSLNEEQLKAENGVRGLGNMTLGVISGICFVVGALCSAAAGYISMSVPLSSSLACGVREVLIVVLIHEALPRHQYRFIPKKELVTRSTTGRMRNRNERRICLT